MTFDELGIFFDIGYELSQFANRLQTKMNSLRTAFASLSVGKQLLLPRNKLPLVNIERKYRSHHDIPTPKPGPEGGHKQYRRYVALLLAVEVMYPIQ